VVVINQGKYERIIVAVLALLPSVVVTLMIAGYWMKRWFPWWSDGGNWLKHTNAILGNAYPMWNEGTYQYPPLFFILLAFLKMLTDDSLFSLKMLALLSFFFFPTSMYCLANGFYGSPYAGVVAAWLTAFFPLFLEYMGWGGYPNILGFTILSLAFRFTIKFVEHGRLRDGVIASFLAVAVTLVHHLTTLIMFGTLVFWVLLSVLARSKGWKRVVVVFAVSLLAFVAYRLLLAWPSDFVLFNEAAYYRLRFNLNLQYIFKTAPLAVLFAISCVLGALFQLRGKIAGFKFVFLIAWLLVPVVGTQGYLLKITLDYNRIFFFVFQPLILLASSSVALPVDLADLFRSIRVRLLTREFVCNFSSLAIALLLVFSCIVSGVVAIGNINSWYNSIDPYGDSDKFGAVEWLANLSSHSVVVAEEPVGRWIEGISEKRVMLHTKPRFLFMKGELEREYAARALLTSWCGVRGRDVWIFEQAPFGRMSPLIAFRYLGEYVDAFYLCARESNIVLTEEEETVVVSFSNATESEVEWISRSAANASFSVSSWFNVENGVVEVKKTVHLDPWGQVITLAFNVFAPESVRVEGVTLRFNFMPTVYVGKPVSEFPLTLSFPTAVGRLNFFSEDPYEFKYELEGGYVGWLSLAFRGQSFRLRVSLEGLEGLSNIETYMWREIAKQYSVSYLVLPKFQVGGRGEWRVTRPEYAFLLDPSISRYLRVAWESESVIILEYKEVEEPLG